MIDSIGIVETKKIIAAIQQAYNIDMSDYALTTLKRRFVHLLNYYSFNFPDDFCQAITNNNINSDELIDQLLIDATELFRDPSLWRELREQYLPEICKTPGSKIWMPVVTSGEELYSLMIVLKESGLFDSVRVVASCLSQKRVERIKAGGFYDLKKIEIGEANYTRFSGKFQFDSYFQVIDNKAIMDTSLIKNVEFDNFNIVQDNPSKTYRMLLFRNIMIQYNLPLYEKVTRKLINSLTIGGYLLLGNMETLEHSEVGKKMQLINEVEKIYRKRID